MEANEKELKNILLNSNPVLFLGAGFSYGCKNEEGNLPTGDGLRQEIFHFFIEGNFDKKDSDEINGYTLQELCQFIYDSLEKKTELQNFIVKKLRGAKPEDFHRLLNTYQWRKIYTVNIDDLVENIYRENKIELVVQNKYEEKKCDGETELIKLHGCVNAPEEGLVFSKNEYTTLITNRNFKLDALTTDIVNSNVIFIGASMDESDIDYYISKYENAGFMLRKGRLIFVDPYPTLKLKTRIKTMGGILLEWTTEQFLKYVADLKYNPTEIDKSKKALNYAGFYLYSDLLQINAIEETYESRLYEGYACKWKDIVHEWVFNTTAIDNLLETCNKNMPDRGAFCVSIFGNRFSGKDCALKQVGAYLHKSGYEVIEFNGRSFGVSAVKKYIDSNPRDKFALLVEDAPFQYRMIETLLRMDWYDKQLLILTISRTYYHFKKRYYLEGNPFIEVELTDKITKENARRIYKKIKEKGYTGDLPDDENEAIGQIYKTGSYINLFSDLTYGKGFRNRLRDASNNIVGASQVIRSLYLDLVIFDRADLGYYPSELFVQQYNIDLSVFMENDYSKLNSEQKLLVDFLRFDENGLVLKNRLLVDMLWKNLSRKQLINELKYILVSISSYISEESNTYWRIIFESLLKDDVLVKKFKLKSSEILDLYYGLKDYYSEISYYWLQLGIAEQREKDYSKALNHLLMAHKIKPRAYQIQHAIARNYLKNANDEKDDVVAKELFIMGEKKILELINSRETYKEKAKYFSIHCYVHEKIKFYKSHSSFVEKKECRKMKSYIDSILSEENPYLDELIKEFVTLLKENNMLDLIPMKPGDRYFVALYSKSLENKWDDSEDIVVDSY